jgi:hypothetical protein
MNAKDYMNRMYAATGTKLIDGHRTYSGKDGHLRLAREIGAALPDFTAAEQREILTASYSTIYIRACNLRPALDAKEWVEEIKKGAAKHDTHRTEKDERP